MRDNGARRLINQNVSTLSNVTKQLQLKPIGFRDTSPIYSPSRDNTNQTGTTRVEIFPQVNCQDLVLAYSNYYIPSSGTVAANTNSINVKASIEINGGTPIPVYFNGARTVSIAGGATIFSDTVNCMISPTDVVFIRTYWDAGTGGYIPMNINLDQSNIHGSIASVKQSDGATYGSDLTDNGNVTSASGTKGFGPRAIFGATLDMQKALLLVGDSIVDGTGDTSYLIENTGFPAIYCYNNKIGSTKISIPGETANGYISNTNTSPLTIRMPFVKNHTDVLCDYGINDVSNGRSLAQIQADLLRIWRYFATRGLRVYQTTITPKTTTTDLFMTLANQTVTANESVRLALNVWLRDTSPNGAVAQSNGTLLKVFDTAATVETNGKWNVYTTPVYSGTVATAGTNYITDNGLSSFVFRTLAATAVVKITGGTGAGQTNSVWWNDGVNKIYLNANWTTIPDATSTYQIYYTSTNDGTHPSSQAHRIMANVLSI
jgi:lysophospholipase L1-like esterase